MKKYLVTTAVLMLSFITTGSFAQGKFSATVSNVNNIVTFSLMPNVTTSTGFSDIEFFLVSPTSSPAFTWGPVTANTTNFPGMTATGVLNSGSWEIIRNDFPITGYNVDHFIYTGPAPATTVSSYTGGTAYQLISLPLIGAPPATVNFTLLDVEPGEYVYYAVTDQNGGDLRPASLTNYFYPTTSTTTTATYPGTGDNTNTVYYLSLSNVPVPLKFTGFSATKQNNNALLNWAVANESFSTDHYEVERSLDGTNFTSIASVEVKGSGSSNTYNFTDQNIYLLKSSGIIYYRIQEVDKSGLVSYTQIQAVKVTSGLTIVAYPNPARNIVSVSIFLAEQANLSLNLTDASGKIVQQSQLFGAKGSNINKINLDGLATGTYLLKVNSGTEIATMPIEKQ